VQGDVRGAAFRQPSEGRACRVRLEGPACRVRCATFDNPFQFRGHDRHAPPIPLSEGRARRVRQITMDYPPGLIGHDKRAAPAFGGTRLSRPQRNV